MYFGNISFTANPEQNPVMTRINDAKDKIFYVQETEPCDNPVDKVSKNIHNAISLEHLEDKEGNDLKKAQLHNLSATVLNPLVAPQAVIDSARFNIERANSLLQKQKAIDTYQQK